MNKLGCMCFLLAITFVYSSSSFAGGDYFSAQGVRCPDQKLSGGDYFSINGVRAKGQGLSGGDYFSEDGTRAKDQSLSGGDYRGSGKKEKESNIVDKRGGMLVS